MRPHGIMEEVDVVVLQRVNKGKITKQGGEGKTSSSFSLKSTVSPYYTHKPLGAHKQSKELDADG